MTMTTVELLENIEAKKLVVPYCRMKANSLTMEERQEVIEWLRTVDAYDSTNGKEFAIYFYGDHAEENALLFKLKYDLNP
jgi:hypothetical protein